MFSVSAIKLALTVGGLLVAITGSYFGSKIEADAKIKAAEDKTAVVSQKVAVLEAGLREAARTVAREEIVTLGEVVEQRLAGIESAQADLNSNMRRLERIIIDNN